MNFFLLRDTLTIRELSFPASPWSYASHSLSLCPGDHGEQNPTSSCRASSLLIFTGLPPHSELAHWYFPEDSFRFVGYHKEGLEAGAAALWDPDTEGWFSAEEISVNFLELALDVRVETFLLLRCSGSSSCPAL